MPLALLETHTANNTSANLDFTTCITSAYDDYEIHIVNLIPSTNATAIQVRMSTDGGATFNSTSNYNCNLFTWTTSSSGAAGGGGGQNNIALASNVNSSALGGLCYRLTLSSPLDTAKDKMLNGIGMSYDATGPKIVGWMLSSWLDLTPAVNAFRIYVPSGNLLSGIVRVYGIASAAPPVGYGGGVIGDNEEGGFQIVGCPFLA